MIPPVKSPERLAAIFFASALILGAALLLAAGPAPQLIFPSDVAAYLDACQRSTLGQWMGRDFTSAIGPAAILPTVLAMKFWGANIGSLVLASVFVWLGGGAFAWLALRPRLPAWLAAGFALFVAATAAAPYTLDFGTWKILSYAMLYNRLAWAALSLAAGVALLPRTDGREPRGVAAILGASSIWLWLLKPNYLLVLFPLVVFHWFSSPRRFAWLGNAVLGAAAMLAFVWICVPFSPVGYVATHLGMARVAPPGLLGYTFERSLRENVLLVLGLGALWGGLLFTAVPRGGRLRVGLVIAAAMACTFVTNLTNCQFSEIPVWGALGWLAAGLASRAPRTRFTRLAGVAGLAFGLGFTWQPLASLAYNFAWKRFAAPGVPPAVQVASANWRGMPMRLVPGDPAGPDGPLEDNANYALWLNDGLALLARVRPGHGPVLNLDWANPFPFATGTAPVPGDDIAWHVGRTMGPAYHPDAARLLAGADVVMEPRRSIQPDSLAFKRDLFAPGLTAAFTVAGESPQWRVWVRRR